MKQTILAIIISSLAVFGQAPKDVDGWDKIKWGMTISDVSKVYEVQRRQDDEFWTHLTISPIKVGDMGLGVDIAAKHGAELISKVQLSRLWTDAGFSAHDFETLKILLIQKYGAPVSEEKKMRFGDMVTDVTWIFPSTSIVLELGRAAITLDYAATDKKALGVL